MKSILISIKPKWVAKILNGDKTIEIRKGAPKDWKDFLSGKTKEKPKPMTGYIYCTKDKEKLIKSFDIDDGPFFTRYKEFFDNGDEYLNGKVIAKFTLWAVTRMCLEPPYLDYYAKKACVSVDEIINYQKHPIASKLYAWHISDLVIFDNPKELDQFEYPNPSGTRNVGQRELNGKKSKKHPPESWCYVEVKETTKHESY